MKKRFILYGTLAGCMVGVVILSPVMMVIFDYIHTASGSILLSQSDSSVRNSLTEVFQLVFLNWTLAHAFIGASFGFMISMIIYAISGLEAKGKQMNVKRVASLSRFESDVTGLQDEIDRLKLEVNHLLKKMKQSDKYW